MRVKTYESREAADAASAAINTIRGYPKVEVVERLGGGSHVEVVVTETDIQPIPLKDGTWAVRADRLEAVNLTTEGSRSILNEDVDEVKTKENERK